MQNFTFLAVQGPEGTHADLAAIADVAVTQGGRLSVLHLGPVPVLAYTVGAVPYGAPIVSEGWVGQRNQLVERLTEKQQETRAYLTRQGLTGEVSVICVEPAAFHDLVGVRALFVDMCIVQNSLRNNAAAFDNVVYGLLFEAPGPVMLNLENNAKALAPDNVLIAWNSSLPAARAVRAALPILKTAREVTVACFDPDRSRWADGEAPGADLASWLSHHGCHVNVQEYSTGHQSVAHAIFDRAEETLADLIVMGAYGRRRWSERIFGGTTQFLINQTDIPVLISH